MRKTGILGTRINCSAATESWKEKQKWVTHWRRGGDRGEEHKCWLGRMKAQVEGEEGNTELDTGRMSPRPEL